MRKVPLLMLTVALFGAAVVWLLTWEHECQTRDTPYGTISECYRINRWTGSAEVREISKTGRR